MYIPRCRSCADEATAFMCKGLPTLILSARHGDLAPQETLEVALYLGGVAMHIIPQLLTSLCCGQTVDGKNLVVRLRSEPPPRGGDRPRFGAGAGDGDDNAKIFVSSLPPSVNSNEHLQVLLHSIPFHFN